ncbi:hypothetical protein ACMXYX_04915 [Neptuniibacter sp. QD72_48]|uniref:hypothetical protein n=1 Tax=Neptuniibacter sp. QD72_48 TaxID=3398214 RepID=UPI0039F44F91
MSATNSPHTTPPYSGTDTSSLPPSPETLIPPQYVVPVQTVMQPQPASESTSDSINWSEVVISFVGLALVGTVGYFTIIMDIKDDISSNRERISVIENKVENLKEKVLRAENKFEQVHQHSLEINELKLKVSNLEKEPATEQKQ